MGCGPSCTPRDVGPPGLSRSYSAKLKGELALYLTQDVGLPPGDSAVQGYVEALHAEGYSNVDAVDELTIDELRQPPYSFKTRHAKLVEREREQREDTAAGGGAAAADEVRTPERAVGPIKPPPLDAAGPARLPQLTMEAPTLPQRDPAPRDCDTMLQPGDEPTAPWLHIEADAIQAGGANDALLRKVPRQINLVTIFGAARGGKSTLMSLLCGKPGLFRSSPGGESFTKGIVMANFFVPLARFSAQDGGRAMSADDEDMVVGFVDAEGQGDRGTEYDLKLISAPMLLSRVVIFNWNNSMQKDKILDELMVMTQVARRYSETATTEQPFHYLAITFQGCRGPEIEAGEEHRLSQLLDEEEEGALEDDKGKQSRNKTRKFLRASFKRIRCHLFPRPVDNDAKYQKELAFEDLTPDYRERLKIFRAEIAVNLQQPQLFDGQSLTGPNMAGLVDFMADKINRDESFVPTGLFAAMEEAQKAHDLEAENELLREQLAQ
eukprot:COSAG02_NODE_11837_length_1644_cov_1.519741_1_plen_493_part_10